MGKFADDAIRPIIRSLDDMPIHVRQLAELFRGQGAKLKRNKSSVNDIDRYDNGVVVTRGGNTKATHFGPNGRPIFERGTITEIPERSSRGDNATNVGNYGNNTDDGGHLGAHRFYGDTPDEGIAPQASNLNRGAWKTMENEWADWVKSGHTVDYEISVKPPGAVRPDSFDVTYRVTDPNTGRTWIETTSFDNAPGQVFDRTPRAEM